MATVPVLPATERKSPACCETAVYESRALCISAKREKGWNQNTTFCDGEKSKVIRREAFVAVGKALFERQSGIMQMAAPAGTIPLGVGADCCCCPKKATEDAATAHDEPNDYSYSCRGDSATK